MARDCMLAQYSTVGTAAEYSVSPRYGARLQLILLYNLIIHYNTSYYT